MTSGQILTLLDGEEIILSIVKLKAKANKGTSYISLWAEREIPTNIQEGTP